MYIGLAQSDQLINYYKFLAGGNQTNNLLRLQLNACAPALQLVNGDL